VVEDEDDEALVDDSDDDDDDISLLLLLPVNSLSLLPLSVDLELILLPLDLVVMLSEKFCCPFDLNPELSFGSLLEP
jgi:hypothetical protein